MTSRIVAIAFALSTAACTVDQATAPPFTGPSDYATSLVITASPDVISLGQSFGTPGQSSTILVKVYDEFGQPKPNVDVRLEVLVGSTIQDCGELALRTVRTGSNGMATVTFTAPGLPLPFPQCFGFTPGNAVTIQATPVGTDFQAARSWTATIRMVPLGVFVPPAETPVADFVFAPTTPAALVPVQFDGSLSCGGQKTGGVCSSLSEIVSYRWDFSDGHTETGRVVSHDFGAAQTYSVTLTVTNDRGLSHSTTKFITVGPQAPVNPTAAFTSTNAVGSPPGQVVNFNGAGSTAIAPATIASWSWDFGDGRTGSGEVTNNNYALSGTASGAVVVVTLTVTDSSGRTDSVSQNVTVP
jgi:PKD repeat protein